jgi:hypothetical protein
MAKEHEERTAACLPRRATDSRFFARMPDMLPRISLNFVVAIFLSQASILQA